MTWKRVATALVLIPVVVGIVLFTPTAVVAVATAVITVLALWEYFALGDAIGHRAYRVWTIFCSILFVFSGLVGVGTGGFPGNRPETWTFRSLTIPFNEIFVSALLFLFVLGLAVLTLWTRRPLVEALPAAGISASAMLLVAFPLSFAVRLHKGPPE